MGKQMPTNGTKGNRGNRGGLVRMRNAWLFKTAIAGLANILYLVEQLRQSRWLIPSKNLWPGNKLIFL